jgi:hypothetical protein
VWQNLDQRSRDVIAADAEHTTREFKEFEREVNRQSELFYNDPEYFANDPYTFKYSQYAS